MWGQQPVSEYAMSLWPNAMQAVVALVLLLALSANYSHLMATQW